MRWRSLAELKPTLSCTRRSSTTTWRPSPASWGLAGRGSPWWCSRPGRCSPGRSPAGNLVCNYTHHIHPCQELRHKYWSMITYDSTEESRPPTWSWPADWEVLLPASLSRPRPASGLCNGNRLKSMTLKSGKPEQKFTEHCQFQWGSVSVWCAVFIQWIENTELGSGTPM